MAAMTSSTWGRLVALAALLSGCGQPAGPAGEPATNDARFRNLQAEYVGEQACASCHEDLFQSYQSHGMARSLYPLTPENAVEDFSGILVTHEASGFYYTAYARDGAFYQEEFRLDALGRKTHQLVRRIDYVVGSGTAARSYLTEEGGRYHQLPLTWYTQAGRWDLSPGYREANARFGRAVPDRCMACHNDVSEPVPFVPGKFTQIAEGIGCERCHGPGSLHVETRLEDPEPPDSIDYTIVNPAHLALDLRLDVCQQCHLNATVSVLREGREAFGFRPGQPLAAHVALFDLETEEQGTIAVISHADRMRQSPCFLESTGMDCTTCHNPHEGFREAGPGYFNQTCIDCHATGPLQAAMPTAELQAQHAPDAACFSCHMPKVEAEDAPHSSFTDHYIRVVEAEERVTRTVQETQGKVVLAPYFERDAGSPEGAVYEGMAYAIEGRRTNRPDVLAEAVRRLSGALPAAPAISEGHYLLGFARLQLGEVEAAIPALEEAVRLRPGVPERLNTLAQAYEAAGRPPAAIEPLYREALAVQPAAAEIRVNFGRFLEAQGRLDEALAQYRQAAAENPWLAPAHYNLGTALLRLGDAQVAARHLQEAITLEPDHADALVNLGILHASQGDLAQAGALFQRAVDAAPDDPNALSNLGTYHLQRGAAAEAAAVLQRAVDANPQHADAQANLALALFQLGDADGARRHAEVALRLNPGHQTARQVLAALG